MANRHHTAISPAVAVQPAQATPPADDAITHLLHRRDPDHAAPAGRPRPGGRRGRAILVLDENTLDQPDADTIGLVTRHGSGQHHQVVSGINLLTRRWTDGERLIANDDRRDNTATDGRTKNDRVRAMLAIGAVAETGTRVHLRGDGFVRVVRLVSPDGNMAHWATDDLGMEELSWLTDGSARTRAVPAVAWLSPTIRPPWAEKPVPVSAP